MRMTELQYNNLLVKSGKMPKPASKKRQRSKLEVEFEDQLNLHCITGWKTNYKALQLRKFELDFAWPEIKFAVEIQGACHRIKSKFKSDTEKSTLMTADGWTIMYLGRDQIYDGSGIKAVKQKLNSEQV